MGNRDDIDDLSRADALNQKGIECADRGWLDEAERYFRKALELDPEGGHTWDNLAGVLADKGRFREALAAHLRAVELEPEVAAGHYSLAAFLTQFGLDMAEAELQETLELDPEHPDARLSLGLVLADMGRTEEAVGALEAAVAADPDDAQARHELALLLLDEGEARGAIRHLRHVLRLDPEAFEARVDLGVAYMRKGFYAEAGRAFEEAAAQTPDDAHLRYSQASLHVLRGEPEAALGHLAAALASEPDAVRAWLGTDPTFDPLRGREAFQVLVDGRRDRE